MQKREQDITAVRKLEKRVFRGSRSPGSQRGGGGAGNAGVEGGSPADTFTSKLKKEGGMGRPKPIKAVPLGSFTSVGLRANALYATPADRGPAPLQREDGTLKQGPG
jgi:hypothetical protein